mmetsp:Transcript_1152/g.3051  ORF Transcript_1152/g.3051 Transcript_1152/m.3051 type:complete len:220 (-) Transcript_1152:95-754(-)
MTSNHSRPFAACTVSTDTEPPLSELEPDPAASQPIASSREGSVRPLSSLPARCCPLPLPSARIPLSAPCSKSRAAEASWSTVRIPLSTSSSSPPNFSAPSLPPADPFFFDRSEEAASNASRVISPRGLFCLSLSCSAHTAVTSCATDAAAILFRSGFSAASPAAPESPEEPTGSPVDPGLPAPAFKMVRHAAIAAASSAAACDCLTCASVPTVLPGCPL